jgi:hypothetical protein
MKSVKSKDSKCIYIGDVQLECSMKVKLIRILEGGIGEKTLRRNTLYLDTR